MIEIKIIGRVGSDATTKQINGQTVINFSVAHSHKYTNAQGQKVESTTWVRCDYWVKKDSLAQYIKKGTQIYCSGTPKSFAWKREDNSIASALQMTVHDLQLLSAMRTDTGVNVSADEVSHLQNASAGDSANFVQTGDDLPF